MNNKNVTLDQVLSALKYAIVQKKGGSVDAIHAEKLLTDLDATMDDLDIVEFVMIVEKELKISVNDTKATEEGLYEECNVPKWTVQSLAENILSLINGSIIKKSGPIFIGLFFYLCRNYIM